VVPGCWSCPLKQPTACPTLPMSSLCASVWACCRTAPCSRKCACHGRNSELPQLRLDPHHAEAYVKHAGAIVTQRHNMLVDALAGLARSVGATVRTSQPRLGTALVTVTDETSGEGRRELQDSGLRGDLLMALSAERILVDVTVPRATAMSNMHLPPGACVKGAELVVGQVSRSAAQRHTPVHHVSKTSSRASGVPVASLTLCPSSLGRDVCSFQPALSTRRLSPARGSTRARRHTLSAQCLSSQRQSTAGAQRAILPPSHPIS